MILILREDVKGLGKRGEKVTVADGYGRNFLIPRGLAFTANEGALQQLKERETVKEQKELREKERAQRLATQLEGTTIIIKAKHGEGGRLFGSITNVHIAEELKKQRGLEVDRKRIEIKDTIKMIGHYEVTVRLYSGITATININIHPED
ncbi:MAG: 50S ribosomal protein L9 [Symbiobacteriaceae bacterium]|nr:50S ribosomal protein L9 [Symbiobacteriaceae bacterium]